MLEFAINIDKIHSQYGGRSSVVEQWVVVPLAAGSIPVDRPIKSSLIKKSYNLYKFSIVLTQDWLIAFNNYASIF